MLTDLDKVLVFTQKAISRENRIRTSDFRSTDDSRNVEIAACTRTITYAHGHIGKFEVVVVFVSR